MVYTAEQARLIKTLPVPLGTPKGKECVWKLARVSSTMKITRLFLPGNLLSRVEASQLGDVPRVPFNLVCFLVLQPICPSRYYLCDDVWPDPG